MKKHREGWGCVYSVLNLLNNNEYIGKDQSGDPENHRWKRHKWIALHTNDTRPLYRALRKGYNRDGCWDGFKFVVIWRGPQKDLYAKEVYYIAKRHTWKGDSECRGYNLTIGGDGFRGKHSKITKKRCSNASNRRWKKPGAHEEASNALRLSYKENPERRQKLSVTLQRYWLDPISHKDASNAQRLSYKEKPERCKKVSEGSKRRFEDPAEIKKHSDCQLRRFEDPAEGKKISASLYRWYEDPEHRKSLGVAHQSYWKTSEAHEKASDVLYSRWAAMSSEERSRIGIKARDTRRRNAAKLKKK